MYAHMSAPCVKLCQTTAGECQTCSVNLDDLTKPAAYFVIKRDPIFGSAYLNFRRFKLS